MQDRGKSGYHHGAGAGVCGRKGVCPLLGPSLDSLPIRGPLELTVSVRESCLVGRRHCFSTVNSAVCTHAAAVEMDVDVMIAHAVSSAPLVHTGYCICQLFCSHIHCRFTWGGEDPPVEGDFVVVPKGQTLSIDVDTPILSILLIDGGSVLFDDNQNVSLRAEHILIVKDGLLQVRAQGYLVRSLNKYHTVK